MDVGMMGQCRSPSMQHQRGADLRAQMPGISGNGAQRLYGHLEQQAINAGLVGVRDSADRCRQGEYHVVVIHGQQVGLACCKPALRRTGLALWAMPVATGVVPQGDFLRGVGNLRMVTGIVQCNTCPPSAALRHCSMADMTLSCPRLR